MSGNFVFHRKRADLRVPEHVGPHREERNTVRHGTPEADSLAARVKHRRAGRTFDERRWGSVSNASQRIPLALGVALNLETGGHIVDVAIWPPRVVSVLLVFTPTTLPTWVADGSTFLVTWRLGVGIGSARESVLVDAPFAPPYAQLVLPAAALQIPIRRLTIEGAVTGTPALGGQTLGGRFFAAAAPWSLSGLGEMDTGGTSG
jgi:hypothetical protein